MKQKTQATAVNQTQTEAEERQETRRKIGLMGGTFNPPHLGHLLVAEQVYEALDLDNIHFMPTAKPGHAAGKETIDASYRVDMVDYAIEDNPHFSLNLTEVNRGGTTYTIDTIKELKEASPETDYYFIIGEDSVMDLAEWKNIEQLLDLVQFVGVKRPGYQAEVNFPIIWVDTPELDISSSDIRQRVSEGQSIKYLTPDRVRDYIEDKGLYKGEE
mgnify:FL=1